MLDSSPNSASLDENATDYPLDIHSLYEHTPPPYSILSVFVIIFLGGEDQFLWEFKFVRGINSFVIRSFHALSSTQTSDPIYSGHYVTGDDLWPDCSEGVSAFVELYCNGEFGSFTERVL